jgi:DNA topoisomerase VI subunit B
MAHIERKSELRRRRQRRAKLQKLKAKMAKTKTPHEAQQILQKIKHISPFWQPPATILPPAPATRTRAKKA